MAKETMYGEAIATAIIEEMQHDSDVVFYGQNMAMTERDPMLKMFGRNRVRIAPISETAEIGIAVGAALTGLRPIVELWMSEFMLVAMDQVLNEAPRLRYMSGGQVKVPLVLKAGYGFAAGWGGQHSTYNGNGQYGIWSQGGSTAYCPYGAASGNASGDVLSFNHSFVDYTGGTAGVYSPAANVLSSDGSYIRV